MIEWYRHTCHSPNISAGMFLYQCHRRDLLVIQTKAAQYHLREPGDVAVDAFYSEQKQSMQVLQPEQSFS